MPLVTHFCGVCGCRVPPTDLDAGRAAMLNHVTYCGACAAKAGLATETRRPEAPTLRSTAVRRPVAEARATTAPESRTRTRQRPASDRRGRGRGGLGVVLAGLFVIAAVVVIAAGLAFFSSDPASRGSPASEQATGTIAPAAPPPPAAGADRARDARTGEARAVLARIEEHEPPATADLAALVAAREVIRQGVEELDRIVARAAGPEAVLDMLVARGRGLQRNLERRIEDAAEAACTSRLEVVEAYVNTGHFDRALRVFEDLPPGLEATTWGERMRRSAREVESRHLESLRAEASRRDEGWTYVSTGASVDGWRALGAAALKVVADTVGYLYLEVASETDQDVGVAFEATGCHDRSSYRIRVDVRGVEGDLVVYVRGPAGVGKATGVNVPHRLLPRTDGWWTLQIEVDGDRYRLFLGTRMVKEGDKLVGIAGGFGLGLKPRGRVQVRNVRVTAVP